MREGVASAHWKIAPPEGELPQAGADAVRRPRLAGLGTSPTVAARQLPLGGSDWIGLFGGCFVGDAEAGPALALLGAEAAVVVGGERVSTWRRLFLRSGR